jgi:hypothetical protein
VYLQCALNPCLRQRPQLSLACHAEMHQVEKVYGSLRLTILADSASELLVAFSTYALHDAMANGRSCAHSLGLARKQYRRSQSTVTLCTTLTWSSAQDSPDRFVQPCAGQALPHYTAARGDLLW